MIIRDGCEEFCLFVCVFMCVLVCSRVFLSEIV